MEIENKFIEHIKDQYGIEIEFYDDGNLRPLSNPAWHTIIVHLFELFKDRQNVITALESELAAANKRIAESVGQEPVGKVDKWINANTAICSGEGFAAMNDNSLLYVLPPIPAEQENIINELLSVIQLAFQTPLDEYYTKAVNVALFNALEKHKQSQGDKNE